MVPTLAFYLIPTFFILFGIRKLRERKWGFCRNKVQLDDKVAIVTGANSGIGYEIAKELANRNARVVLACRDIKSARNAIERIEKELRKTPDLIPLELDLASLESVRDFVRDVKERFPQIHLLINNAGVAYPNKEMHLTKDGLEIHFGVNHLGHFFLTKLLLEVLEKSSPSRVVVVASTLHERGKLNFGDPKEIDLKSGPNLYADSKLANVYFSRELAKKLHGTGVTVYALCPGFVYTGLFRHSFRWYHYIVIAPVAFFFMRSSKQGAQTPIYCATEPQLAQESGLLYRDCAHYKSKVTFDESDGLKLWEESERLIAEKVH